MKLLILRVGQLEISAIFFFFFGGGGEKKNLECQCQNWVSFPPSQLSLPFTRVLTALKNDAA